MSMTITVGGVVSPTLVNTYNAAGLALTHYSTDMKSNSAIAYARANVTAGVTNTQVRTTAVLGVATTQTRTIVRNALREIMSISAWV
jgi:hypothetical protein